MPDPGDLQVPGWLSRNWQPREPFDPTPWLQERYRRQVEQAKLPLEIQGLELRNKEAQLAIEHQGLINDTLNEELNIQKDERSKYEEAIRAAASRRGGAAAMGTPDFRSKKYTDLWMNRQKADAQTAYGQALHQTILNQVKDATDAMPLAGRVIMPRDDGTFDPQELADLMADAREKKLVETVTAKGLEAQAEAKAKQMYPAPNAEQQSIDMRAKLMRQASDLQILVNSNPTRGDIKSMLTDVQNKIEAWDMRHRQSLGTPAERNTQTELRYRDELEKAIESKDPEAIKRAQATLEGFLARSIPSGETITTETSPSGTTTTTIQRGGAGAASANAKAAASAASKEELYHSIKETIDSIDPGTVGPVGKLRTTYEKLASFAAPGSVKPVATEAKEKMLLTLQQVLTAFRQDAIGGRMNVQEQSMLRDISDVTGWFESPDTARTKLQTLLQLESSKAIRQSARDKKPAPDWALKTITEKQLQSGFNEDWITDQDAVRWHRFHRKKK